MQRITTTIDPTMTPEALYEAIKKAWPHLKEKQLQLLVSVLKAKGSRPEDFILATALVQVLGDRLPKANVDAGFVQDLSITLFSLLDQKELFDLKALHSKGLH